MTVPRVAVILVNYQDYAAQHLPMCYDSLQAQTYPAESMTVFIVDHASTERSRGQLAQWAPAARLLRTGRNMGWGTGNNVALEVALAEGYDYLIMLNMDVVVDPGWLHWLVETAQDRPDLHIIQSRILLFGSGRVNSLGNRIQYLGYGYCQGYGQDASTPVDGLTVDFASGAAMLVKHEVFERIGRFREDYFLYGDDLEFCWRARVAGYRVGVAEQSICYHKYSPLNVRNFLYDADRNRLTTMLTLAKPGTLALVLPCLLVAELIMTVYACFRGWGAARARLFRHFLRPSTWASIAAHRRGIQTLRRVPDARIVRQFAGQLVLAGRPHPLMQWLLNPLLVGYWTVIRWMIVW